MILQLYEREVVMFIKEAEYERGEAHGQGLILVTKVY